MRWTVGEPVQARLLVNRCRRADEGEQRAHQSNVIEWMA
jgi:hypothetical protein